MAYFGYNTCIACERRWLPEDDRKGYGWYRLRDQEVTLWICYRCITRMWQKAAVAARIGPCPTNLEKALQTQEFEIDVQDLLKKHKSEHDTESMDDDI